MLTNYPDGFAQGVSLRGLPLAITHPGKIFWVGNSATLLKGEKAASNGNKGTFLDPFSTIDYAVGQCVASRGDIIMVRPNHTETISAAGSLTVDIAGIGIFGLGRGTNRPVLDFTATAGTIEMDAANTRLSNFILKANVSAVVVAINVDADNVELDNLMFTFDATGDDFITMMDIDAFDYAYVHDCVFTTEIAAGSDEAIRLDDSLWSRIEGNIFNGQWAVAAIVNEGALCANLTIKDNVIHNSDTSVYNGIDFGSLSSTGIVANNRITALYATAVAKVIRTGDMTWHGNTVANAVSERAVSTLPATSSG